MLISVTCAKFWHALRRVAMPFHPFSKWVQLQCCTIVNVTEGNKCSRWVHITSNIMCACNRVFYTSLHVWLCSAAAVSCSFPGHPFKLRFCSFPGHPFKTWVLKIWKKVKKHIPHLLILVQIKYSKGLLQNQTTNFVQFLGVVIVQNTRKRPELPAIQGLGFEVVPKLSWFPQARYVTQP